MYNGWSKKVIKNVILRIIAFGDFFCHIGSSGCGVLTYGDITEKLKKRTTAEITKVMEDQKSTNLGLYQRSDLIRKCQGDGFRVRIPLRFVTPFFGLDVLWPPKQLLTLEFRLNSSNKNLIIDPKLVEAGGKYEMRVMKMVLDLSYVTLEQSVRQTYYSLISEKRLVRTYQHVKESHFSVNSGSTLYFFQSTNAYGRMPRFISLMFIEEATFLGNNKNRFHYHDHGLVTLQVFVNGYPHYNNTRTTKMKLTDMTSVDVSYLYSTFLSVYPAEARDISLERFFKDMFIFTVDLQPCFDKESLSLLTNGSIDISLEFGAVLTKNLVLCIHSHYSSLVNFGANGEILENE